MKFATLAAMAVVGSTVATLATPARADIPFYPNAGTENPANYNFSAGNNGYLRTWFVGRGGAAYTVRLGAIVNGVDRGLGLNNQTSALGELFNYGAINAGDTLKFYIFVTNTETTFTSDRNDNSDGVQHFFFQPGYTGSDFGIPTSASRPGSYFGTEDLTGGGDFNYADLQFVARIGAIPEPATWAFMILGFGAIGGAMRARRRVSTTVRYA